MRHGRLLTPGMALLAGCILMGQPVVAGDAAITHAAPDGPGKWDDTIVEFPLKVGPTGRYLVDAAGRPFLIHGDTAWSLIAQLTREDAARYLEDRQARGFNTILASLIEHRFSTNPPANAYGQKPFLAAGDFTTPNDRYFAHADWVLRRAAELGLLVLLAPSYTGYDGGEEGWYRIMAENGPERLNRYGRYLGRRYGGFDNILWLHGGDYDPPDKDLVRAIVDGIRAFDDDALHSAHCAPGKAAIACWPDEDWLSVNTVYTYGPVHAAALDQYARAGDMPFFLIESVYENEHEATARRLRAQAYSAVLSGAAGQVFGNNPIWHFDGPGLYPAPVTWRQALAGPGSESMTHLRTLLDGVPWWRLKPDIHGELLTGGRGRDFERAVAAGLADGSLALVYMPGARRITVDPAQLGGPRLAGRWYDPTDGSYHAVAGSPFPADGPRTFSLAEANASGAGDWVLVLESVP